MPQTLKKQALTLTIANGFTRGLGFLFRLMTARLMGAEAIGVMELSASAAMLALTALKFGQPSAAERSAFSNVFQIPSSSGSSSSIEKTSGNRARDDSFVSSSSPKSADICLK